MSLSTGLSINCYFDCVSSTSMRFEFSTMLKIQKRSHVDPDCIEFTMLERTLKVNQFPHNRKVETLLAWNDIHLLLAILIISIFKKDN